MSENQSSENCEKRASTKRHDRILALALLILAAVLGFGYYMTHRTPALRAEVTIDGETVEVLDLSKDQEVTIHSLRGGTNHLVVKDGEIWCDEASCPDKICIYQGKQSLEGSLIVCLPNLMIVEVIGPDR